MGPFSEQNQKPESSEFLISQKLILSFTQKLTGSYFADKSDVNHNTGFVDFFLSSHCEIAKFSLAAYSIVTV